MTREPVVNPLPRALLIFLDGVGIGRADPAVNPVFSGAMPFLRDVLGGRLPSMRAAHIIARDAVCIGADANLRVAGLPQSGTGQATLYTGVNCARVIRQHFGPYLYSTLRPIVSEESIFARLLRAGIAADDLALANAFPSRFFEYMAGPRRRMIAGVHAAQGAGITLRDITHLRSGMAVSTDITAGRWREIGHPDAPVVGHREAGAILARIAQRHRFTLFEYFATDKAGHERSHEHAHRVLRGVDQFLEGVFNGIDPAETLVVVTSDHGNIEDLSTKSHTRNRVPVICFGRGREAFAASIKNISHVTPALVTFVTSYR